MEHYHLAIALFPSEGSYSTPDMIARAKAYNGGAAYHEHQEGRAVVNDRGCSMLMFGVDLPDEAALRHFASTVASGRMVFVTNHGKISVRWRWLED